MHSTSVTSSKAAHTSRGKSFLATSSIAKPFIKTKLSAPKGVALDVFSALPPEIQREVAAEMAIEKHSAATSGENNIIHPKFAHKNPTKKVNSMLNYLQKK